MHYWWVNQNQTHREQISGGFLWSPKRKSSKTKPNGIYNQFYDNMRLTNPGDIVFSFYGQHIKAIGIVTAPAQSENKPADFGDTGLYWSKNGWYVPTEFIELPNPVKPKDHMDILGPLQPKKYYPLKSNGDGLEGVYLAEIPDAMAAALIQLIGPSYQNSINQILAESGTQSVNYPYDDFLLPDRQFTGDTTKPQQVNTRRGQDLFKIRLRAVEKCCRLTGVTNSRFLIASHIKPWSKSTDDERIDGCNGLLLAPHIDHLFNKGLISFSDTGGILISNLLDHSILAAWKIDTKKNVGAFNEKQQQFLKYHREYIFK
jgi:hypothetical protein